MNPLLSLSFSSSGSVAAGAESAVPQAAATMEETAGANKFGRLLDQSAKPYPADRQSLAGSTLAGNTVAGNTTVGDSPAGFNINGKSKRAATMEGMPAGRPEDRILPVIPPEAELLLADEKNAGTLLGLLDLASQTRLQLTAGSAGKGKAEAAPDQGEDSGTADGKTLPDGKKVTKGEWFILPVYPELVTADAAGVDDPSATPKTMPAGKTAGGNLSQATADQAAAAAIAKAAETAAGDGSGVTEAKLNTKQQIDSAGKMLAEQALVNQASEADAAAAQPDDIAEDVAATAGKQTNTVESMMNKSSANSTARSDSDKSGTANQSVSSAGNGQSTEAAEVEAELLARQAAMNDRVATAPELSAESKAAALAESAVAKSAAANQTANPLTTATEATELQKATGNSQSAATTIFENADNTASVSADGKPASALASAAAIAESLLAKQQRGGVAENVNQPKQAQSLDTDTAGQQTKVDAVLAAGGRAEASLSGFGSVLSGAGQSQSDAILARLDAATVTGARQTAEQAKAQSVRKSVTEQLKQVNLLAQNAAGQLKERINLMVRQNIHVAEIRLDPADLGQMQIRVNLQQEQASVQFIVQQQHAKELLEQQMPRLREMLQQQGIQLGEGHVQQQRHGDSQTSGRRDGHAANAQSGNEQLGDEQATAVQLDVKLSERIVDYYA